MELTQLKFVVDTSDLKNASVAIKQLADDVSKLNKPMQEVTVASKKLNQEQEASVETTKKVESSTKKQVTVLERQQMILEFMTQGFSKGQSSQLAYAKAAGALTDEIEQLGKVLQTQRTLMGTDPFDKSLGAIQALKNEYTVIKEVQRLYNAELGLSKKQMEDLAREKLRLIEKFKLEGATLSQIKQGMKELESAYVKNASAENSITQSIRSRQKALEDTSKAQDYVAKEFDRVNRLTSDTGNITSATNNKLIAMEKALRKTGMSADEQKQKLDQYRKSLESIQKAAGNRQVDYLSRALGPQITDIFVGLATGQSPMMVLLQQGGQLRDQFALAGVAAKDMGDMLKNATVSMAGSVKDTAFAVGSALGGAIIAAGKATNKFIGDITGVNSVLEYMRYQIALSQGSSGMLMTTFKAAGSAIQFLTGAIITGAIAALIAFGVALKQVVEQEAELNRVVNLSGGALGLTKDRVLDLSKAYAGQKGNISAFNEAIGESAKSGKITADSLKQVTEAAVILESVAGVKISETVKKFTALAEKPTEKLREYAVELGTIDVKALRYIESLEKQGNKALAAAEATKIYSKALKDAAANIQEDMGYLESFFKTIGSAASDMWNSILNIGRKGTKTDRIAELGKDLQKLNEGGAWYETEQFRKNRIEIITAEIAALQKQVVEEYKLAQVKEENSKKAQEEIDLSKKRQEIADYSANMFKEIAQLTDKSTFAQYELNKAQEMMIKLINDPKFIALPETTKSRALATLAETSAKLELVKAEEELRKQNAKATEEYIKNIKAQDDARIAAYDNNLALNNAVKQESETLMLQSSLIGATDEARKRALKTRQIELELAKELRDIEARKLTAEDQAGFESAATFELAARQRAAEKMKNLNTEIAIDAATKIYDQIKNIQNGISDAIVTALFEGGQSGSKKLRDLLIAELKKPITVVIQAVIGGITGINTSSGSSNLLSNIGSSLFSKAIGNIGIGGTTLAAMGESIATGFMTTIQGGSVAEAAAAYQAAGMQSIQAAGMQGISSGLSAGASIANALPYVAAGLVALNALGVFRSTRQVNGGISGTLGSGDISNWAQMRKSGTLFRGPSYWTENRGKFAGSDQLQNTFYQLRASMANMAEVIGLSSEQIKTYTKDINISFKDLTDSQIQEKLSEVFSSIGNDLAALALGAGATAEQLTTLYNNVMQQRYELENKLLELQGDTLALRERERAKIYETNKALFDQITALEDKKAADEAAAEAMEKLTNVTSGIVEEINRLRGVDTNVTGLQSQFETLTMQARAGDLIALAKLPDITKNLETLAGTSAVSAIDVVMARARLAQSLQDTLSYVGVNGTSSSSTSVLSTPSLFGSTTSGGTMISSVSGNQELLVSLISEVQGLRSEVRADVSHNAKTAKILERANQDGETLSVSATIDGGVV